jgi:acyl-coenzyme A synthetase/AMP-(fatty) acid ligase
MLAVQVARPDGSWVDDVLLAGPDREICQWLGRPVDRRLLRELVAERQLGLASAGLRPGGTVALRLPPSVAYVVSLLAAWRSGGQVILLDYRLTEHEIDLALAHLAPQLVVAARRAAGGPLSGYYEVAETVSALAGGRPAATDHVLVQLSSGSTGPSKVIGRTAPSLVEEIDRYERVEGMPRRGESAVVLSSLSHTFGLIGVLLYNLYAGARTVVPRRLAALDILDAVAASPEVVTMFGVPFHYELLAGVSSPPPLPRLARAISGGELVRPALPEAFASRYGIPLGQCFGMTEVGVIAMDVLAEYQGVGRPAPGIKVGVEGDELLVGMDRTPYIGAADPSRWHDGWLHTRDAASIDPATGSVLLRGRLDSQVAIGGMKVDLNEIEHTLTALPGVVEAVVVFDGAIEAFLSLEDNVTPAAVEEALAVRLAPFKRPRLLNVVTRLPRTATGKRMRDLNALRAAASATMEARS